MEQLSVHQNFSDKVKSAGGDLKASAVEILQLNVTKKCNLFCKHCHVEAGPDRTEHSSREILEKALSIAKLDSITTVDITGGAPEMNPDLEWFLNSLGALGKRVIVRSNLTILKLPDYAHFIDVFVANKVEIVSSLPDYVGDKMDKQRGTGSFRDAIEILQKLNSFGYGKPESGLVIGLVHNPVGAYLPGPQEALEAEYKRNLLDSFGVTFNQLYCITNMPMGRFLEYLHKSDNYEDYMDSLIGAFNPAALDNVMCKNTLSVSWDGKLYDCDFNQMLDWPLKSSAANIMDLDISSLTGRDIVVGNHCYGCTAGAGSSCQGATTR